MDDELDPPLESALEPTRQRSLGWSTLVGGAYHGVTRLLGHVGAGPIGSWVSALNVYSHLTTILSLGAIGHWISTHWHAVTRAAWEYLLVRFSLLPVHLSDSEKDALTVAVFFVPMGVASTAAGVRSPGRDWTDPFTIRNPGVAQVFTHVAAIAGAAGILFALSHQTASTIFRLWLPGNQVIPLWVANVVTFVMAPVMAAMTLCAWLLKDRQWLPARRVGSMAHKILRVLFVFGNWVAVFFLFRAVWMASKLIGPISAALTLLVFYSVLWTVIQYPRRLVRVSLLVGALLVMGWSFAIAEKTIRALEAL